MSTSQTDVAKLYIAYLNRAIDPPYLAYWSAQSIEAVAAGLGGSVEFLAAHKGESSTGMVRALYHQMFGHAADAPGVQYWAGLIDSGAVSRADLPRILAASAQGSDQVALESKAAASLAFCDAVGSAPAGQIYLGKDESTLVAACLDRVTDAASLAAFKTGLPTLLNTVWPWGAIPYTGQVQATGYVQGATVFNDGNGNGQFDQGEWSAVTDSQGRYLLMVSKAGIVPPSTLPKPLLVTGGTDTITGLAQHGTYAATTYSKAVNALSSLHQQMQQLPGGSAAQASARLAEAFGLGTVDVTKASPLYSALDTDPSAPAAMQAALRLETVTASLDGLQLVLARTLVSLAGGASQLSEAQAYKAVAGALAGTLAQASGATDLSSASFVSALLASSVAQAGNASLSAAAAKLGTLATQAFGQVVEAGLANIEQTGSASTSVHSGLAHIGQASVMLQASLADKLAAAMAAGHPETLLRSYLGSALTVSTPAAHIADIDPAVATDAAALARANSGAGVPAISVLDVSKLYVAFLQRPAELAGQQYWQAQSSLSVLQSALGNSAEFRELLVGRTMPQVIDKMYLNMFGHSADTPGLLYWAGLVQQGALDLTGTAIALTQAAQGSDALALQARTVAAAEFTAAMEQLQPNFVFPWGTSLYASAWLAGVVDDATLSNALSTLPALFKSIENAPPGPTLPIHPAPAALLVGVAEPDASFVAWTI